MATSRYYVHYSQELKTLRDKLFDSKTSLQECKHDIIQLRKENQRLIKELDANKPTTEIILSKNNDSEQMLKFKIEELKSKKDILELQLNESRQENETLHKALDAAESIYRDDGSDLDEAKTYDNFDKSTYLNTLRNINNDRTLDKSQMTSMIPKLRDFGIDTLTGHPEIVGDLSPDDMKHIIVTLFSQIKVLHRRIKQLTHNGDINEQRRTTMNIQPISKDCMDETDLNCFRMEYARLTADLASLKLDNSSLQRKLITMHEKLQRAREIATEVNELRKLNWNFECKRMDTEFSCHMMLTDLTYAIKLMTKVLVAANPLLQLWNSTGKPICSMVDSNFYASFEQIGFFLRDVKNYDQELAKMESKACKKIKETGEQEKPDTADGSNSVQSSDNETSTDGKTLPNHRYRKAYRHLKCEYDELRVKHKALIERYKGIKSGLTQAMYKTAVDDNKQILEMEKREKKRKQRQAADKLNGEKPEKIVKVSLSCDDESY